MPSRMPFGGWSGAPLSSALPKPRLCRQGDPPLHPSLTALPPFNFGLPPPFRRKTLWRLAEGGISIWNTHNPCPRHIDGSERAAMLAFGCIVPPQASHASLRGLEQFESNAPHQPIGFSTSSFLPHNHIPRAKISSCVASYP